MSQPGSIVVNDAQFVAGNTIPGKATPYPSTIGISNQFVGVIQKVAVVIPALNHAYAHDIDLLLVAPSGEKIVLMSDVALNGIFSGASITIDQEASASFPASLTPGNAVPGGNYKPTDFAPADVYPDSVAGPFTGSLTNLATLSPAGTWRLFVIDDKFEHQGEFTGGWQLKLWTTPVFGAVTNTVTTLENIPVTFPVSFTDTDTPGNSVVVTAVAASKTLVSDTNIVVSATGNTRNVTVTPNLNQNGSTVLTVSVNDGRTTITTNVNLTINPVNQRPTIALNTNRVETSAGGFVTTAIATVGDVDGELNDIRVIGLSGNTNIVPENFIVDVTRTGLTRNLVIAPRGTVTGTVNLSIYSVDSGSSNHVSVGAPLSITINPVTQALFSYPSNLTIADNNTLLSQPLVVSNVFGTIGKVTATLNGITHPNPADLEIRLKGPGASNPQALLLSGNGGSTDAIGTWLALDDAAANPLPSPLTTGTFRPNEALSVFNDLNPNGTWTLEARDTSAGPAGAGTIRGGYTLKFFTKPVVRGLINTNLTEGTSKQINFTVADYDGQVTNIVAASSNEQLATVAVTQNGTNGVLTITGKPDQNGTLTVTVTARDNSNYTGASQITVVLNPFNTPPNISPIAKQLTYAGLPLGPVDFTVDDTGPSGTATDETPGANITVVAKSDNQKLVPDGNIILGGSGTNRTFTVYPIGAAEGTVTISLTATDAGVPTPAKSTTINFLFQVLPPASPLYHNAGAIVIADSGTGNGATNAAPYPSTITVAGQVGLVRQLQVTLIGIQHPRPQDLGALLVGPNGEKVILMSGAGGNSISNVQVVFADSASAALPSSGTIVSGSYRSSNLNGRTSADFPGTGSDRSVSPNLSVFNGIVPNGNWSLYVRDFTGNDKGDGQQIASGWMINFVTEANLVAIPTQETPEDTVKRVSITIGDNQPGITVTLTATSDRTDIVPNANMVFEPGNVAAANQILVITPAANRSGDVNITVTATVGTGTPSSRTFLLKVLPVNDDPVIAGAGSVDRSKAAGLIDGPRVVNVSDQESAANDIVLTATSSNTSLIPDANVILQSRNDGSGNWDITIVPNGILTGETTITLSARVGNEKPGTKAFKYTVTRNRSFASEEGRIEIRDNSSANPYPSVVRVSNVPGLVSKLSVTLLGFSHTFPDDADILLVSPDGSKSVVLLADAGGGAPTNSVANTTMTFDDDGLTLSSEEKLLPRTYKPANFGTGAFPSPAPSSGYQGNLATFNGISPNGDWKLYVLDDTFSDSGSIERGWILVVETAPSISSIGSQVTREDTALPLAFTIEDADTEAQFLRTWALSSDETLVNNTNLVVAPTNTLSRTLTVTPNLNQHGTNTITVYVADNRVTNSRSFHLTVTAVDDPPIITVTTNLVRINEDTQTNIVFSVRDVDSVLSITNASILSANTGLVPNNTNNLSITGPVSVPVGTTGQITAAVMPALNQFGESLITFTLRDGTTPVERPVTLAVTAINDAPTLSITNNAYTVNAGATLAGIPVTVGDAETPARNLVFLPPTSSNQGLIPNGNITLGGANADRLLSVTAIGAGTGTAVITLRLRDDNSPAGETTTNITFTINPAPGRTFANTASINIRDNNTAVAYGSEITVPALEGVVHEVVVTLDGLTHSSPDDIDVLLVSPGGTRKVIVLSDAGGNTPISNGRIVFRDSAGGTIPDNGPLLAGDYRPTNYGEGDNFPSPAPVAPYGVTLADFNGIDPEGVWRLYIVDDTINDAGSITGGWSLKIVTTPRITTTTASPVVWDEDEVAIVNLEINDLDSGSKLDQLELFAISSHASLLPPENVTFTRVSGDPDSLGGPWIYQASLRPVANAFGTNQLTIGIRRKSDRATDTVVLANTVRLVNDAPVISRITERTTDENVPITITFLVTDVDTAPRDLSIRADSGNDTLVSDTRLQFFGQTNFLASLPSSEISLTMSPNTNQTGTATITILVTDNSTNAPARSTDTSFSLRVTEFNDPPTIRPITDIAIPAGSTSTNIAFGVDDSDSATVKVTATSSDESLVRNANIRIFRDQAGTLPAEDFFAPGNRWIRVTSEVGRRGSATITVTATDNSKTSTRTFVVNVVESRERGYVNNRSIAIRDNSSADPYPSIITVSDMVGDVDQVKVRLNGFAHGFPSDVDVLLVSPGGRSVMLMSDAGGGSAITNLTITFNDAATQDVPSSPPLANGEYRPRNYDPQADPMPVPAPASPYGTTLGSIAGTPASGDWKLYIVDDTPSDSGFVNGGWELFITTKPRIVGLAQSLTVPEDGEFTLPFTIVEESFAEVNFTFTTESTNAAVIRTNDLSFRGSGTNWTLTGRPVENVSGASRITVNARNPYGQVASSAFTVTVNSINDAPFVTDVADQTIAAGTSSAPIEFTYGDAETPQKDLTFTVSSSNTDLIPTNNVFVTGGFLTIAPVGNRSGTSEITLTATDLTGQSSDPTTFLVTVTPALQSQFANPGAITIPTQGNAAPYPSTLEVSRMRGSVARVTVTLAQLNHPYPADVDILLVGPAGQKVVLMSDSGGSESLVNVRLTFDDSAAAGLPFNPADPIPTGSYKPTNQQGVDDFPNAPEGPISATLSVFNGTDPNGVWSLYVVDDASPDGGNISGGWILNIYTTDPTISAVPDQTTAENVAITVPFNVQDADTAATNLVVIASTDNPALLALTLGGTGNSRNVLITPAAFESGTGTVTLVVNDGTSVAETSFLVTVTPVNQAPEITGLSDRQVPSNVTLQMPFTVSDRETAASNLVVSASINRPEFGSVNVTGTNGNRTLVFRSSGDQGEAFITVTADDGTTNTVQIITVVVGPAYVIAITDIADQTMLENEGPRTVAFTVIGSETGNVVAEGVASNTVLVNRVTIGGTGTNRTATITLNPSQSGTSLITITATDDRGGLAVSEFDLTVTRGNIPPVLAPIPPQQTRPGVAAQVPLVVSDVDNPLTDLIFTSENTNPALVRNVVFAQTSTGGFIAQVNVLPGAEGTATVTIRVSDGGVPATQAFVLTVVENPPVLGPIADQTTSVNTPAVITLSVNDQDTPLNELVFSATTSNPALVSGVTFDVSGATVTATVNLVADAKGIATVTVTVKDSANTASQTFALSVTDPVPPTLAVPTITTNPDGTKSVTITWENGGELEWAPGATGPWTGTGNRSGSFTETASEASRVYRVKQ